jgi:nucleotide-binding universal stress UspA family protein
MLLPHVGTFAGEERHEGGRGHGHARRAWSGGDTDADKGATMRLRTIVVGIDGSVESAGALRWAADRQSVDESAICALYAYGDDVSSPYRADAGIARQGHARALATGWVNSALSGRHPAGPVRVEVVGGPPGDALTRRSRHADALVLGAPSGHLAFDASWSPLSSYCIATAGCLVICVPPGPVASESRR